jgi:Pirin/Carboxymuconolactone decarboxylase family
MNMMLEWNDYQQQLLKRIGDIGRSSPETVRGYRALSEAGAKTGKLDAKTRELVALAVAVTRQYYDNHGNKGTVRLGDAMWLTAGRGLIHNEQPAAGQTVHLLQLWVNLPKAEKLVSARYQDILADETPVRHEPGAEIRVFSSASGGVKSPTQNYAP